MKGEILNFKLSEKTKIGITLIIFGIFILASVFIIFDKAEEEKSDDPTIETHELIKQSGIFMGGAFLFAGIILFSIEVYKKINKFQKT